jgi:hypothetical protein
MPMRVAHLIGSFVLAFALCGSAYAAERYYQPTAGNQFVTTTDKYLYVVWSVPKDLTPFRGIASRLELEAFIGRTAVYLCHEHLSADASGAKPCKLQVVRMNSNDEYTKSAAGGFKTVAELVLPHDRASAEGLKGALALSSEPLRGLFTSFEVKHERIPLPSAE